MANRLPMPASHSDQLAAVTLEARNQLTSIQGYVEMVEEELAGTSPQVLADLASIRAAGDRLTELVASLEEEVANARNLASVDPLTGIANRRAFFARAESLFATDEAACLILLDVDKFKHINDHYGHIVGDEVLRAVVERFQRAVRDRDMLARLAGDEFVLLLPGADYDVAMAVASRLRQKVTREPVHTSVGLVPVTVSMGVAERNDETPKINDLVERADIAMYNAKRTGRNRVA
jgi:diguanylate cyclase (GGDEF)-like protein